MAKPRVSRLCKPFMLPFLILSYVDGRKLLIGHCFGINAALWSWNRFVICEAAKRRRLCRAGAKIRGFALRTHRVSFSPQLSRVTDSRNASYDVLTS